MLVWPVHTSSIIITRHERQEEDEKNGVPGIQDRGSGHLFPLSREGVTCWSDGGFCGLFAWPACKVMQSKAKQSPVPVSHNRHFPVSVLLSVTTLSEKDHERDKQQVDFLFSFFDQPLNATQQAHTMYSAVPVNLGLAKWELHSVLSCSVPLI